MIDFILGRRGEGKSTLGYFLASKSQRTLVFDPRGGIRHHNEPESSAVATTHVQLTRGINGLLTGDFTEIIFTPDDRPKAGFAAFCQEAVRLTRHLSPQQTLCILVDEIHFADLSDDNLDWLIRCTSIDRVRLIFTGHRPKDVPTDIRGLGNRWMLFKFTLPIDFDVIEKHTSPAVAARVKQLGPREFVLWDDSKDGFELFRDSGAWRVPFASGELPVALVSDLAGEVSRGEAVDMDLPLDAD